jgi:hypothetical protein
VEKGGITVLPRETWMTDYYEPMERLLAVKSQEWAAHPQGLAVIAQARQEIDLYRTYSGYYGYAFFVMQRPERRP